VVQPSDNSTQRDKARFFEKAGPLLIGRNNTQLSLEDIRELHIIISYITLWIVFTKRNGIESIFIIGSYFGYIDDHSLVHYGELPNTTPPNPVSYPLTTNTNSNLPPNSPSAGFTNINPKGNGNLTADVLSPLYSRLMDLVAANS